LVILIESFYGVNSSFFVEKLNITPLYDPRYEKGD